LMFSYSLRPIMGCQFGQNLLFRSWAGRSPE
jgi:hypothetical protein